ERRGIRRQRDRTVPGDGDAAGRDRRPEPGSGPRRRAAARQLDAVGRAAGQRQDDPCRPDGVRRGGDRPPRPDLGRALGAGQQAGAAPAHVPLLRRGRGRGSPPDAQPAAVSAPGPGQHRARDRRHRPRRAGRSGGARRLPRPARQRRRHPTGAPVPLRPRHRPQPPRRDDGDHDRRRSPRPELLPGGDHGRRDRRLGSHPRRDALGALARSRQGAGGRPVDRTPRDDHRRGGGGGASPVGGTGGRGDPVRPRRRDRRPRATVGVLRSGRSGRDLRRGTGARHDHIGDGRAGDWQNAARLALRGRRGVGPGADGVPQPARGRTPVATQGRRLRPRTPAGRGPRARRRADAAAATRRRTRHRAAGRRVVDDPGPDRGAAAGDRQHDRVGARGRGGQRSPPCPQPPGGAGRGVASARHHGAPGPRERDRLRPVRPRSPDRRLVGDRRERGLAAPGRRSATDSPRPLGAQDALRAVRRHPPRVRCRGAGRDPRRRRVPQRPGRARRDRRSGGRVAVRHALLRRRRRSRIGRRRSGRRAGVSRDRGRRGGRGSDGPQGDPGRFV
ncbi:MAG: hypothetical protein AVDCRST_MAG73-1755, partial [uncultured Thermomicrobiales bacterium]